MLKVKDKYVIVERVLSNPTPKLIKVLSETKTSYYIKDVDTYVKTRVLKTVFEDKYRIIEHIPDEREEMLKALGERYLERNKTK